MYGPAHEDDNDIDGKGCRHFQEVELARMTTINLSSCQSSRLKPSGRRGVSPPCLVPLAPFARTRPRYTSKHPGYNGISAVGVQHLCSAGWHNLRKLWLGMSPSTRQQLGWRRGMFDHRKKQLEPPRHAFPRYFADEDSGTNQIGDKGCGHLAKVQWRQLQQLILS
jgi:hypothetical protein